MNTMDWPRWVEPAITIAIAIMIAVRSVIVRVRAAGDARRATLAERPCPWCGRRLGTAREAFEHVNRFCPKSPTARPSHERTSP